MSKRNREPPKVTGLSPREGLPGCKVTIRGENLGTSAKDLIGLTICGVPCHLLAEWKSPSKIICRTTNCKNVGDVIVTTRSGGVGSCTVKFRGLQILPNALKESAVWMDESSLFEHHLVNRPGPSSPMASHREDALGLSVETAPTMSDEEIQALFPGGTSSFAHKNFEPALYLIENHSNTSFSELKQGLAYLEKQSSGIKTEGPQTFIKANLGTFMNCQDILADIHSSLSTHEILKFQDSKKKFPAEVDSLNPFASDLMEEATDDTEKKEEGGGDVDDQSVTLQKLEELLIQSNDNARKIFDTVLQRKDRADSTRNALNVLNRFKFLFYLPITLERNIKKGDYEVVINDYERAKQLFSASQVPAFKQVYGDVEERLKKFQKQLTSQLMVFPKSLEDQKRLIRYLIELDAPGDPAWDCIIGQQEWIIKLLNSYKEEFLAQDQSVDSEQGHPVIKLKSHGHRRQYSGSGIQIKVTTSDTSGKLSEYCTSTDKSSPKAESKFAAPPNVLYLDELVEILDLTFPDLWKLGQSYFNASIVSEAGGKGMKVDKTKEKTFKTMITETVQHFANLVRAAFLPNSLSGLSSEERAQYGYWKESKKDGAGSWLPQCVRSLRTVLGSLMVLEVPAYSLDVLHSLTADLRIHCLETLFKEATEDIEGLHSRETWVLQMDEHGGITSLPALFESLVVDALQHLKEVVSRVKQGELNIFADYDIQRKTVENASNMLKAFATCLEFLAFREEAEADTHRLRLADTHMRTPDSLFHAPEDSLPSTEQCLVIVLSNNSYVSRHVMPNLMEEFKKQGYPNVQEMENIALEVYAELDDKIFEAYCEQKTEPLVGALEPGVYTGRFEWSNCSVPKGVRSYVRDVLLGAVEIHSEINAIAPDFMLRVMARVFEAIAEEMSRLISCVTEDFSQAGAMQAKLDLQALEEALSPYRNAGTSSSFQEAHAVIPDVHTKEDRQLVEQLLNKFREDSNFILMCFTTDSGGQD